MSDHASAGLDFSNNKPWIRWNSNLFSLSAGSYWNNLLKVNHMRQSYDYSNMAYIIQLAQKHAWFLKNYYENVAHDLLTVRKKGGRYEEIDYERKY